MDQTSVTMHTDYRSECCVKISQNLGLGNTLNVRIDFTYTIHSPRCRTRQVALQLLA